MEGKAGAWVYALMGVMLVSGTANTLLMKLQARTRVPSGPHQDPADFAHPVTQTLFMVLGETLCLAVFNCQQRRPPEESLQAEQFPKLIMAVPAAFGLVASSLVHASYIFIPASVVQMCRGSIVLFACALSMVFLRRRQHAFHFVGVGLVALGIVLVALAARLRGSDAATSMKGGGLVFVGIVLCLGAQLFRASQMVVEERFLSKHRIPPLQVVGFEGVFGSLIVVLVLCIMNPLHAEDTVGALYQMQHSGTLSVAVSCAVVSIALFNWSGMSITKHSSCIARATVDGSRTIFVWLIELYLGWSSYTGLQLAGFICVAAGTLLYNRIVEARAFFYYPGPAEEAALHKAAP